MKRELMSEVRSAALILTVLLLAAAVPGCVGGGAEEATAAEAAPTGDAATGDPTARAATAAVDPQQLQRQTMATMRTVGVAMFAWLTDQAGAASAGMAVTVADWPVTDFGALEAALVPAYLQELPRNDAWGNTFDYRVDLANPTAERALLIRSSGSDGQWDGDTYDSGNFDPAATANDLV